MMKTRTLEKVAAVSSIAIITGWGIYWCIQVMDVFELLALANAQP